MSQRQAGGPGQGTRKRRSLGGTSFINAAPPATTSIDIILPRKTNAALTIRSPENGDVLTAPHDAIKRGGGKEKTHDKTQRLLPAPSTTSSTAAQATKSIPIQFGTAPRVPTASKPPSSKSSSSKPTPTPTPAIPLQRQAKPAPFQSSLDIYASNYIPLWLRAVNDSSATMKPCFPLNSLNISDYIGSFAGRSFLCPLQPTQPPPPIATPLSSDAPLSPENYGTHFHERLQNEIAAEVAELPSYYLFNVQLDIGYPQQPLFRLSVPGIRENTPRVDLGDVVLVRPLLPYSEQQVGAAARSWYDSGARAAGVPAPAFSGAQFQAVIWGIVRAQEYIVLRMDGYPTTSHRRCNVMFIAQDRNSAALVRSINTAAEQLSCDPQHTSWLRSMLLPKRTDVEMQFTLPRVMFDLTWVDSTLNYEQQKAVNSILLGNYGRVPFLISGPPGTGKTKTIVEATLQLLRKTEAAGGRSVAHLLVCAPSDPAADTLAIRLADHMSPMELFRLNSWTRSTAEVPARLLSYCYTVNDLFTLPEFKSMMSFTVVVTTCRDATLLVQAQLTNSALYQLKTQMASILLPAVPADIAGTLHWTGLLLDEAAQATEPEALIPLSVLVPPLSYSHDLPGPVFALAGDEFQLGPRLADRTPKGFEISLFQRLFEREFYADHPLSRAKGLKPLNASMLPIPYPAFANLFRNYRSHPAILSTPSMLFYHDTLVPEQIKLSEMVQSWRVWKCWPVLFRQTAILDEVESIMAGNGTGAGGLINIEEAKIALGYVQSLLQHCHKHPSVHSGAELHPREIMIMSPFSAQVKLLRTHFRDAGLHDINIGPLEAFQGLESRIVILCTTRTRLGVEGQRDRFVREDQARGLGVIDEPKRFNVAITRAKEGLIVIGNYRCLTCTGDSAWNEFIAFCHRNNCVEFDAWGTSETLDVGSGRPVGRLEKALRYKKSKRLDEERTMRKGFLRGSQLTADEEMQMNGVMEVEYEDITSEDEEKSAPETWQREPFDRDLGTELDNADWPSP